MLGRLIDLDRVERSAKKPQPSNQIRQLLMFIESLCTACGRAHAQLRIFG